MLSPEDQKYYEDYFGMFGTPIWNQFITDIEKLMQSYKDDMPTLTSTDEMLVLKGHIQSLEYIVNFAAIMENQYNMVNQNAEGL